jgi:hexokinase
MYLGEITRNVLLALIDAAPKHILFGGKATNVINKHYGLDSAVMSDVEEAWGASQVPSGPSAAAKALSSPEWESSLSLAERDRLERVRKVLISKLEFATADVSLRDAAIVRRVVAMIAGRAAKLSGVAVAATLVQTERAVLGGGPPPPPLKGEETKIGVGVDGRFALVSGVDFVSVLIDWFSYSLIQFYPNYEKYLRESLRLLVGEEVERRVDIGMAKDGSGVGGEYFCTSNYPTSSSDVIVFAVQPLCALYKLSNNNRSELLPEKYSIKFPNAFHRTTHPAFTYPSWGNFLLQSKGVKLYKLCTLMCAGRNMH